MKSRSVRSIAHAAVEKDTVSLTKFVTPRLYHDAGAYPHRADLTAYQFHSDDEWVRVDDLDSELYTVLTQLAILNQSAVPLIRSEQNRPSLTVMSFTSRIQLLLHYKMCEIFATYCLQ